jgi:hypothetical protein
LKLVAKREPYLLRGQFAVGMVGDAGAGFETDDGRTFAGAAAASIWRFVVFIAFF